MEFPTLFFLMFLGIAQGKTYCDFENGLCGFIQEKDDDFDWTIGKTDTPTIETGPSYDHTLGFNKSGHYLFIETSGQDSWSTARLSSPKYGAPKHQSKSVCVSFYYHIYGSNAGQLSVYLRQRGKLSAPLWSKINDQGDRWIQAGIQIKSGIDYQVVFEAKRGGGFRSDIAIDDVSIINGSCNGLVNVDKTSGILHSIIGTKMAWSFPGASTVHLENPTSPNVRMHQQPSNLVSGPQNAPHGTHYIDLYDSKVVINLIVVGLFFWSIVIILLVYVFLKSRSSKQVGQKESNDIAVGRRAVCTSVAIENPYASQRKSFVDKMRSEKTKVLFPKTAPDEDERYDAFKTKVGLDKGPSSTMYMYTLMPEDIDFNIYAETFEDNRTQDNTNEIQTVRTSYYY